MAQKPIWPELLAVAAAIGISPRDFWQLSLSEWRALTQVNATEAMSRKDFEQLAKCFE